MCRGPRAGVGGARERGSEGGLRGRLREAPKSRQLTPRKRSSDERSGGLYGVAVRQARARGFCDFRGHRSVIWETSAGPRRDLCGARFGGSFWALKMAPTGRFRRHGAYGAAGMLRKSAPNGLNAQIPPLGSIWRRGEACWAWASGDGLGRQTLT